MLKVNYPFSRVVDYLPEFFKALEAQLIDDEKRWGDTWMKRSIEGQEDRTFKTFNDYYDQFKNGGVPIPWEKVVGNALICWVRSKYVVKNKA